MDEQRRAYAGLMVSLDENVGKILACLQQGNLEENTIVIFTNDNGGQTKSGANHYPLRGGKGRLWEGGIRVPCVIRWPGQTSPGSVIDDPVTALDLLPTFIEAAGSTINPDWQLDGVSLLNRSLRPGAPLAERELYWRRRGFAGQRAMRRGKWKVVHNRHEGADPMLFDLDTDIGETRDLANERSGILHGMLRSLDKWESELSTPLWGPGSINSGVVSGR